MPQSPLLSQEHENQTGENQNTGFAGLPHQQENERDKNSNDTACNQEKPNSTLFTNTDLA